MFHYLDRKSTETVSPSSDRSIVLSRAYIETKFNPSSSLMHGLNQSTTISSVPIGNQSATAVKFSQNDTITDIPPRPLSSSRPTVANSILKSSTTRWPPPYENEIRDDQNDLQGSASASFVDDVRRMVSLSHLRIATNQ